MQERSFNRKSDEKRPIKFIRNYIKYSPGSVYVECGDTKIIVTATIEEKVPKFLADTGSGWVTAEYSMLPGATQLRTQRERTKISGRTMEIQRLIGRSLRACVDKDDMGEVSITIDCDVIQADGGTRTASINGGFIALYDAFRSLKEAGKIPEIPIIEPIAAISVGMFQGEKLLDLDYSEDSNADLDANIIMTESGKIIEFQCTAEGNPISEETLIELLRLGYKGIKEIVQIQKEVLDIQK